MISEGALQLREHAASDTQARHEFAPLHTIFLPGGSTEAQESMTIRLAHREGHRSQANMLLNRMYSWRGYGSSHELPSHPSSVTFTASNEEDVIGTLTLNVDSPEGLAADRTFEDELDAFRNVPGAKLCELARFAFDTSSPAQPRLAALFHIIFIYGSMHFDCTDLFIEVNPRHRRFYEVMLGFKRVGPPRTNATVDAPSQLMWLNVSDIQGHIDRHTGNNRADSRSLYSHFFSREEQEGIYGRLAALSDMHLFSRELGGLSTDDARLSADWLQD